MNTLRQLRQNAGITLDQLATRTKMHKSILSKLENDKRRLHITELTILAAALGCTIAELLPVNTPVPPFGTALAGTGVAHDEVSPR